jgi:adenine-specific DNA-methyltransferase
LNTLLPKFNNKIKCIYIDPPYNTDASEIIYKNNYKHSSWITMMENRISLSHSFLTNDGSKIIAIDDTEMIGLSQLLESILPDYDRNVVVVNHHPAGAGLEGTNISTTHEYAIFMTPKGKKVLFGEKKVDETGKINFIRTGLQKVIYV